MRRNQEHRAPVLGVCQLVGGPPTGDQRDRLRELIEEAARARQEAARAQESASSTMRRAVSEIRAAGYTSRDAGALLGVSVQRVSQLDRKPPRK